MNAKFLNKAVAVVMAAAIVSGAVPSAFGGTDLFDNSIVANAEDEVGVGTKWYIGDTIDTDEYFEVRLPTYNHVRQQNFAIKTLKLENTTLPECWPLFVREEVYNPGTDSEELISFGRKGIQFSGIIAPVEYRFYNSWRISWNSETE